MKSIRIQKADHALSGTLSFPGDKSLSHRAIMFGALAEGTSHFTNVLSGEDCVCTRKAFKTMGVKIDSSKDGTEVTIHGVGLHGLKAPKQPIDCGNSGTSMRLLSGILAGQSFESTLTGDPSLSSRPMRRVTEWLKQMGASVEGKDNGNFAPLKIKGGKLKAIDAKLPVASAQVKSAILLAGLYADGTTSVTEPEKSRDHTERFLKKFGVVTSVKGNLVSMKGGQKLYGNDFEIAGDISSAAFFMAVGLLVSGSNLKFMSVLNNPTRSGILKVLERSVKISDFRSHTTDASAVGPEMVSDFSLLSQSLKAFEIKREELPALIDEIPILCVLATQANGRSVIHDADELRVKETDRIESMVSQLSKMGANIHAEGNSIIINGPTQLKGNTVKSFKDHRTAMSLIVAGMIAEGETIVEDVECIDTSFPSFFELLKKLQIRFEWLTP